MNPVQQLIELHSLQPHPEGGWYKQTYKSAELIPGPALPSRFTGDRAFSTAIYFLLEQGNFSAFHRIKSDECWHFYAGDPLELFVLNEKGSLDTITLGSDHSKGQLFQFVVPAHSWFASRPARESQYCFVGCTVAPGFEFDDFELAEADKLIAEFPEQGDIIGELCR